ncbi:MAG: DsbA family protein [Chloroflexi bacterium]|nr:DsbA family protein [Chloroflexota bacterium]
MKKSMQKKRTAQGRVVPSVKARRSDRWLIIGVAVFLVLVAAGVAYALTAQDKGDVVPGAGSEKSKGSATAQVVVEEYADFQCPACRRFFDTTARQLEKEYVSTGKVKFVFRHYAFLGQESRWAAEAAECANDQGRFWDYYDKLFTEQGGENVGVFSKPNLQRFAAELGLDAARFNQCLTSGKYTASVFADINQAASKGVRGTPTLFVNGRSVDRGSDYAVLRQAIEAALSAD